MWRQMRTIKERKKVEGGVGEAGGGKEKGEDRGGEEWRNRESKRKM